MSPTASSFVGPCNTSAMIRNGYTPGGVLVSYSSTFERLAAFPLTTQEFPHHGTSSVSPLMKSISVIVEG
ncbi:hypothetical protein ES703_65475 [subsurface metagenome]